MSQIGKLGGLARPLARQPGIGVCGRGVPLVAALLAMEIAVAIASGSRRLAAAILGAKTLHAGPRLDQRPVNRDCQFADIVGRERVIAGTDCGFGTFAGYGKLDPDIAFKKLGAMQIASKRLWGRT
jgi:hypothetical protein